jgi:hypothetical protein
MRFDRHNNEITVCRCQKTEDKEDIQEGYLWLFLPWRRLFQGIVPVWFHCCIWLLSGTTMRSRWQVPKWGTLIMSLPRSRRHPRRLTLILTLIIWVKHWLLVTVIHTLKKLLFLFSIAFFYSY